MRSLRSPHPALSSTTPQTQAPVPSRTVNSRLGRLAWATADSTIWIVALSVAIWLRYDFDYPFATRGIGPIVAVACAALQLVLGTLIGPYRIGHTRGSYEEAAELARCTLITTILATAAAIVLHPVHFPRSATVTGGAIAIISMLTLRLCVRALRLRRARGRHSEHRVVIFGAGNAARRLVHGALREPEAGLLPVALLDDDPAKARLRIEGVPVRGTSDELAKVAEATDATMLVLAVPTAAPEVKQRLSQVARSIDLPVKVLPPLSALEGDPQDPAPDMVRSLRDIDVADLLGRTPIHLDQAAVTAQIEGKRVLVTGAGGSIGSELCRQLQRHHPASLVLLDRDESGLQATEMSLTGTGLLDTDTTVLVDIRDAEGLHAVFAAVRPQIVFHAAALKHQPLLERFPEEAFKTNVVGTTNVLEAAAHAGVETFVNVSTDKAADPSCVLGYSKRVTERLTADYARRRQGRYVSVRFGNVLGSRGSVIHAFTAQIERGGPVTVTDPDVERFFMLIPEACQLVLEATTVGGDGEVMVLEMGEPVRILQVAHTLIDMSGRDDIEVAFTGLREGEKLSEDLFSPSEAPRTTAHPLVYAVDVPPLSPVELRAVYPKTPAALEEWMRAATTNGPDATASTQPTPRASRHTSVADVIVQGSDA